MSAQKTVLLVDDDNEIIESMRTVLEAKGYQGDGRPRRQRWSDRRRARESRPPHPRYDDAQEERVSRPREAQRASGWPDPHNHDHWQRRAVGTGPTPRCSASATTSASPSPWKSSSSRSSKSSRKRCPPRRPPPRPTPDSQGGGFSRQREAWFLRNHGGRLLLSVKLPAPMKLVRILGRSALRRAPKRRPWSWWDRRAKSSLAHAESGLDLEDDHASSVIGGLGSYEGLDHLGPPAPFLAEPVEAGDARPHASARCPRRNRGAVE